MADKGKRIMSAEELRLEQEEQESRRIQELIDSWIATQEEDPKPPTPISARFPSHPPGFPPKPSAAGTFNQVPPAPGSPTYTPAQIITNVVTQELLDRYWARRAPPVGPGPWYRMREGFTRFRYGTPWAAIDREERIAARERAEARARGIPVPEHPPPRQDDEHLLRIRRIEVPAPSSSEEEEDGDDFDPGEDTSSEEDIPVGSDTSTITEEPSEVPDSVREEVDKVKEEIRKTFFGK